MIDIVKDLYDLLLRKGLTISSIESFTGGLFAENITSIEGASKVYKGGIVSYCDEYKENLVGVKSETLTKFTAISSETAFDMLNQGGSKLNTDIVVCFTGNAGPEASCGKPRGLIFVGYRYKGKNNVFKYQINSLNRSEIRDFAVATICERIISEVNN